MKKITKLLLVAGTVFAGVLGTAQAADKTITVVTSGTSVPYSVIDAEGHWTGIDADLWAEIAKRKNWEIKTKRASFDAIFGELDAGRAEVASNAFAVKPERTEKYYASAPYYGDAQAIVVNVENKTINTFDDLKGKKIGVTNGQASQSIINEMKDKYGFEQVIFEDSNNGLYDMSLGRIDAQACAVSTANLFEEKTGNKVRVLGEKLRANNVALFFPKTEEGAKLRDEINVVIAELLKDGTLAKITTKHLGGDMTKLIIQEK